MVSASLLVGVETQTLGWAGQRGKSSSQRFTVGRLITGELIGDPSLLGVIW